MAGALVLARTVAFQADADFVRHMMVLPDQHFSWDAGLERTAARADAFLGLLLIVSGAAAQLLDALLDFDDVPWWWAYLAALLVALLALVARSPLERALRLRLALTALRHRKPEMIADVTDLFLTESTPKYNRIRGDEDDIQYLRRSVHPKFFQRVRTEYPDLFTPPVYRFPPLAPVLEPERRLDDGRPAVTLRVSCLYGDGRGQALLPDGRVWNGPVSTALWEASVASQGRGVMVAIDERDEPGEIVADLAQDDAQR